MARGLSSRGGKETRYDRDGGGNHIDSIRNKTPATGVFKVASNDGLGWAREYECQFKRTTGRVVSVCKYIRGGKFSGWYLIREPGEISSHKYRKSEILSMAASLSERKDKMPNVE